MKYTALSIALTLAACGVASISAQAADKDQAAATIPDFTQGGKPGEGHDWNLGPTGARGWIFTRNGHSRDARQILVTAVAQGSPAGKVLQTGDVIAESLDGVDREKLIPALQVLLAHEDSVPRSAVRKTFTHLTDADLVALLPDIVQAVKKLAPSNEMFADGIRLAGLDLLSRLRISEGLPLCVAVMEPDRWGERNRTKDCLTYLVRYGVHAKTMLPRLKEARAYLATEKRVPPDYLAQFDKLVAEIEGSTSTPTLVNLADFKTRPASEK